MSYFLRFDGVNDYVSIPAVNIGGTIGDYIELDFAFNGTDNQILGRDDSFFYLMEFANSTTFRIRFDDGTNYDYPIDRPAVGVRFKLKFLRFSTAFWHILIDDVQEAVVDIAGVPGRQSFQANTLGGISGDSFTGTIDVYGFEIKRGGSVASYLDPSASGGTGAILPDTVGTDDGALINFDIPACWVFYSSGGVTVEPTAASTETASPSPGVFSGASLSPTAASTESLSPVPSISAGASVFSTAAITYSFSPDPVIASGASVNPGNAVTATLSPDPSVTASDPVIITPTVATTYSLSLDPGVASGASLSPTAAETTTLSYDPVVGVVVVVNPTAAVTESDSLPPVISSGASVSVDFATTQTEAYNPTIGTYGVVNTTTAYTASEALSPEVIAGVEEFVRSVQIDGLLITSQTLSGTIIKDVTISGININSVTLG